MKLWHYVVALLAFFAIGAFLPGPYDAAAKRGEYMSTRAAHGEVGPWLGTHWVEWNHVRTELADTLKETHYDDNMSGYPWRRCITNWHKHNERTTTLLVCPNGYTERW